MNLLHQTTGCFGCRYEYNRRVAVRLSNITFDHGPQFLLFLNLAIKSSVKSILGPTTTQTLEFWGSIALVQYQAIYLRRNSVQPIPRLLSIQRCLWSWRASYIVLWYGSSGIVWPSFCGRPMIWLKQQSPLLVISLSLCWFWFHIQNGLFFSLCSSWDCCCSGFACDWTNFCRSLNVTAPVSLRNTAN
jgi:hypothetical protein